MYDVGYPVHSKHIFEIYMLGSLPQRVYILCGLHPCYKTDFLFAKVEAPKVTLGVLF